VKKDDGYGRRGKMPAVTRVYRQNERRKRYPAISRIKNEIYEDVKIDNKKRAKAVGFSLPYSMST
jgi:hypothetical protein